MATVLREITQKDNLPDEKRIVFRNNSVEEKENYVVKYLKPNKKGSIKLDQGSNEDPSCSFKETVPVLPKLNLDRSISSDEVEELTKIEETKVKAASVKPKFNNGSFRSPAKVALLFGYVGIGHDGFYPTRNRRAVNLYNEIIQAIFTSEHPDKKIKLNDLKIACKTPKDGSALCQMIVLPPFGTSMEERVEKINENLPHHIVCFGARKVTPTFHPKYTCKFDEKRQLNYQVFKYVLPSYALDPDCQEFSDKYRVSEDILNKANDILQKFQGRHLFHNFSGPKKGAEKIGSYPRYVIKAQCEQPRIVDSVEIVEFTFMGENFMVFQVTSIVGFVVAYTRGLATEETLARAWEPALMDLPCAPASGLILENVKYGTYNCDLIRNEYKDEKGRFYCPLDWSSEDEKIGGLKGTIVASIVQLEKTTDAPVANWIAKELGKHAYQEIIEESSKVLVNDTKITPAKFEDRVAKEITTLKIREKIRNYVYQYSIRNAHVLLAVPQPREPLDFIQKAQNSWERRIFKSLNSMFNELGIPLSKKRPISEQKDLEAKWCELSTEDIDLSRIRPLYSPKDFLDVLLNVRSPNWSSSSAGDSGATSVWGQIKVPLKVKTFSQIKKAFHEMAIKSTHVGLDNVADDYLELGYKVLESLDPLLAREYAKHGCFPSIRTQIWSQIFGLKSDDDEKLKFLQLKSYVIQHDMLVDKLIFKDIRLTSSNDDQYFVFEDVLYQILLAFSRDASVLEHFHGSSASPATGYLRGRLNQEGAVVIYPPNGVIPFHGFSMYLTPLCFLTEDPVLMYNIFKELYCRYFFRLHILSSHSQGILSLCLLLETLLQEIDPQLTYHFANKELHPLKIAVKWLMRGFSGYLNTEQILLLWDRILAYDTLEILPMLAVAIFVFRKPFLMAAENQANLEAMLSDISTIKVVPLLTWFLRGPSSSITK